MFPLAAELYIGRRVDVVAASRDLLSTSGDLALTSGCFEVKVTTAVSRDRVLFGDDVTVRRAGDLFDRGLLLFLIWVSRSA